MKTLIISKRRDFRLHSLIAPLQQIMEVGFIEKNDSDSVDKFNPDIVFSDTPYPDSYDLNNINNLKPFIHKQLFVESKVQKELECDIVFLGQMSDISELSEFYKMGYNVRHYNNVSSMTPCYSGSVNMSQCFDIYKSAKVSPIPLGDIGYRELDIIMGGGNLVKYVNKEQFIKDCELGINGRKFPKKFSKATIMKEHTNFDRLAKILEQMGLKRVADKVRSAKGAPSEN